MKRIIPILAGLAFVALAVPASACSGAPNPPPGAEPPERQACQDFAFYGITSGASYYTHTKPDGTKDLRMAAFIRVQAPTCTWVDYGLHALGRDAMGKYTKPVADKAVPGDGKSHELLIVDVKVPGDAAHPPTICVYIDTTQTVRVLGIPLLHRDFDRAPHGTPGCFELDADVSPGRHWF